ncbi:MAG: hypothetical protein M1828_005665 [Chrysothrix sp. TS-e1954]|nr:MAG: hypothetical protein M1828_005665 [Chrysothrix sp. TS-e1954]
MANTTNAAPAADPNTPPRSRTSSGSSTSPTNASSQQRKSPMSIDLSSVPSLSEPSPPSNTLLVTNLQDPAIFAPATLTHLQTLISTSLLPPTAASVSSGSSIEPPPPTTSEDPQPQHLLAFSPLPSLRRIILTFSHPSASLRIRTLLDGEELFHHRIRCYFGTNVDLSQFYSSPGNDDDHGKRGRLLVPKSEKQFFISPPPSPPAGWEIKHEDPPNREVHPGDLSEALGKLERAANPEGGSGPEAQGSASEVGGGGRPERSASLKRGRAGSTPVVVYHPEKHSSSSKLPAIAVEDTGFAGVEPDDGEDDEGVQDGIGSAGASASAVQDSEADLEGPGIGGGKKIIAHTSRPPVELME